jgi:hypothetical protein
MLAGGVVSLAVAGLTIVFEALSSAVNFLYHLARQGEGMAMNPAIDAEHGITHGCDEIEIVGNEKNSDFFF